LDRHYAASPEFLQRSGTILLQESLEKTSEAQDVQIKPRASFGRLAG